VPQLRDNRTPAFGTYCAYADGDDDMCTGDAAAQVPSETHTFVGEHYVQWEWRPYGAANMGDYRLAV
jgi:hypothetical protein